MNTPIDILLENGFKIEKTDILIDSGETIYFLIAENGAKFKIIWEEI